MAFRDLPVGHRSQSDTRARADVGMPSGSVEEFFSEGLWRHQAWQRQQGWLDSNGHQRNLEGLPGLVRELSGVCSRRPSPIPNFPWCLSQAWPPTSNLYIRRVLVCSGAFVWVQTRVLRQQRLIATWTRRAQTTAARAPETLSARVCSKPDRSADVGDAKQPTDVLANLAPPGLDRPRRVKNAEKFVVWLVSFSLAPLWAYACAVP